VQIAIIPARGGSKRIPRKNILPFLGRPMLSWPISAAVGCGLFDRVLVSTDDDEIAEVARNAGAEVPFKRPAEISDDFTPTRAVINHAINSVETLFDQRVDLACCIYATAPMVLSDDISAAHASLAAEPSVDFVFAAAHFAYPVQRALVANEKGTVDMLWPEYRSTRSQDLHEAFHDAGQFYWGRRDAFLENKPMFSDHARPYMMPRSRVQDIDTPEDWAFAEKLMQLHLEPSSQQAR
jgi:pseudaminic acid cytidylyltransferase